MKYLPYAIIAGLLIVIFFLNECSTNTTKYIPVVAISTKVVKVPVTNYYPAPYPVIQIDSFERPQKIDSSDVVDSFYKATIYNRHIVNDTNADLWLKDTVTQNKLRAYKLTGTFFRHETTITNTITTPLKNRVFLGFCVGSDLRSFDLMPKISFLPKNDKTIYSYSYNAFTKFHYVGMDFKIVLRK